MSRKSRFKKLLRQERESENPEETSPAEEHKVIHEHKEEHAEVKGKGLKYIYDKKYKALMIIPFLLLLFAIISIGVQYATTGDFINRAVSLKGGITLTVPSENVIDLIELKQSLIDEFIDNDFSVRSLTRSGRFVGFTIDSDIDLTDNTATQELINFVSEKTDIELIEGGYSIEGTGAALGSSFFKETLIALLIAFVFMGIVVFLYFRVPIPSLAVILAAFSDIIITLAIVNLIGMKISTAGIAAFLMLIGYSVDTDILLSTRVLKSKEGTVLDRVYSAMKTGLTMNITTMIAIITALALAESEVIKQIMTILLIGLFVDIINTWIQNTGILRWYLEKKNV
jgi:preprotein translocase subunit SecF